MKRSLIIQPVFLMFLLLIGCKDESQSLIGKWERVGDDAAGTIIQVEKVDKSYQGKLLVVLNYLGLLWARSNGKILSTLKKLNGKDSIK